MTASHREILKATSLIGGASIVNVLFGLGRMKVAALLLGPAGVGLIGLLHNLMTTGAAVAALGTGTVGTRQIVTARQESEAAFAAARRALLMGAAALGMVAALVVWLLREAIALSILGDATLAPQLGWVAAGIALTVIGGAQTALLTGLRRLRQVALVMILGAVLGSAAAVAALWIAGAGAIPLFVVAVPAAVALAGLPFALGTRPVVEARAVPWRTLGRHWRGMAMLGVAFTVAGLASTFGQLGVRMLVQRELGLEAQGLFHASWLISMTYIGFVLQAMATEYYPRLTAALADHEAAVRTINDQTEIALFLAGPILLAMLGAAPFVIQLLYSSDFVEAAGILRWQVLGDLLKVASWPLAYVLLAGGDGRGYMLTEVSAMILFVALTAIGLPLIGIEATGLAFLGMYAAYLPVVYLIARRRIGFTWRPGVARLAALLAGAALLTLLAGQLGALAGAVVGILLAGGCALGGALALHEALPGPLGSWAGRLRARLVRHG